MELDELQADVATCLAANPLLAPLTILLEFDPRAGKTPADLAANESRFETALATQGVVLVILSPLARPLDNAKGAGVSFAATVPVAIVENPAINRGPSNLEADPPIVPFSYRPGRIVGEVLRALLRRYRFPSAANLDRPVIGVDGLLHYYVLPERTVEFSALPLLE